MSRPKAGPASADRTDALEIAAAEAAQVETALGLAWGAALAQTAKFQADWLRDTAKALAGFQACASLADLVGAAQDWATARARAYADAGLWMAAAAVLPAETAAARAGNFRLPD